ncbi:hypothetical protein BCR35DRAFT_298618, partial [Leucosporidium creatinivorum]
MNFLSSTRSASERQLDKAREISRSRRRSRDQRDQQQQGENDSEDAAFSSPWTGVGSPSSSDFEAISDSEVSLNPATAAAHPAQSTGGSVPFRPSNLSHSLARRNSSQSSSMSDSGSSTPDTRSMHPSSRARVATLPDVEVGDADGDDEQSALEDGDEMRGRGRGRTRRREEDPAMRKSMLEDALRSSLATLLSLSSQHATLSPAMSSASLSSLFTPQSPLGGSTSPRRFNQGPSVSQTINRPSPFAFALSEPTEEEEATHEDAREWNEDDQELSEEAVEFYSEGSDDGTQLGPRPPQQQQQQRSSSRAIPITSTSSRIRERSQSDSLPNPSVPSGFSPIQSRPLALGPSSGSPPTWSRRRRRRGQRYASLSPGPTPASLEERRRARARGTTDAEESGVEPDQGFMDLVDSAKTFMSMPPRLSGNIPATTDDSTPSSEMHPSTSALFTSALGNISPVPRGPLPENWRPAPISSPSSSFPSSDPFLPSSVPTLELSSGPDELSSPSGRKTSKAPRRGEKSAKDEGGQATGWFSWLSRTVELKVWHLVGLCGLLVGVGVGIGAGSLLKHTSKASRLSL